MKPIESTYSIVNSDPSFKETQFHAKQENLGHLLKILRNDIYSDKILAVIREYSCNAYDAHIDIGTPLKPIQITLPTSYVPELKIRDFGMGLSEEEIYDTYISYGASSKRGNNDTIGQLGIGSKSGFCYGDNFIVTSYYNNIKSVYNAALDKSNVGTMIKLIEESTIEPNGIEITVPVKPHDVNLFINKCLNFFKYWNVYPNILNGDDDKIKRSLDCENVLISSKDWNWKLMNYSQSIDKNSYVIMGNISYPINWKLIEEGVINETLFRFISNNIFIINLDIGSLEISPSRESLQYTEYTIKSILAKLDTIQSNIEGEIIKSFDICKTSWEFKCKFNELFEHINYNHVGINHIGDIKHKIVPKLKFNGIPITNGYYNGFNKWDANIGKLTTESLEEGFIHVPIVKEVYRKKPRYYSKSDAIVDKIEALSTTKIVMLDIIKKTNSIACIKWYLEKYRYSSLFTLKFSSDKIKDDFFNEFDFTGTSLLKLSDLLEEYKKSLPQITTPVVKLSDSTVLCCYYDPQKQIDYYNNNSFKSKTRHELNLNTESGYYIPLCDEILQFNNHSFKIDRFITSIRELYSLLKHDVKQVHCFGQNITKSKKFKNNQRNWIDFTIYIKDLIISKTNVDSIMINNIINGYGSDIPLNKHALEKISINIKDKNNIIVKLNDYIPSTIEKGSNFSITLSNLGFNNGDRISEISTYLNDNYSKIYKKYPMLKVINKHEGKLNKHDYVPTYDIVETISEYINLIDNSSVVS